MADQLVLIERSEEERHRADFKLDAHTREIGRRGVAEARRVLAEVVKARAERAAQEGRHAA